MHTKHKAYNASVADAPGDANIFIFFFSGETQRFKNQIVSIKSLVWQKNIIYDLDMQLYQCTIQFSSSHYEWNI